MENVKKNVYMMIGIPGCGKSTQTTNMAKELDGVAILNADSIREELTGRADCFDSEGKVWGTLFDRFKRALRSPNVHNIFIDNTNLNYRTRKKYYQAIIDVMGGMELVNIFFFFFQPNVDLCIERQTMRDRKVPDHVIEDMAGRIQPPTHQEVRICYDWEFIK